MTAALTETQLSALRAARVVIQSQQARDIDVYPAGVELLLAWETSVILGRPTIGGRLISPRFIIAAAVARITVPHGVRAVAWDWRTLLKLTTPEAS